MQPDGLRAHHAKAAWLDEVELSGARVAVLARMPRSDAAAHDGDDAADEPDSKRPEGPARAGHVNAQRIVERPTARADARESEQCRGERQVELISLVRDEETVLQVNGDHRRRHHRDQRGCRNGRHDAERYGQTAEELCYSGRPGMQLAWPEFDLLEEARRAGDAGATERAEQLLCAVGRERQSYD